MDPPSTFVNYIHPQKSSTKKTRPQFQKAVFQVIAWGCVSKLGDAHTSSSFFWLNAYCRKAMGFEGQASALQSPSPPTSSSSENEL